MKLFIMLAFLFPTPGSVPQAAPILNPNPYNRSIPWPRDLTVTEPYRLILPTDPSNKPYAVICPDPGNCFYQEVK